jgi:PAS domain S-box-containing protein
MKRHLGSLAIRLTIWFVLLTALPLAVTAIFVRRTVTDQFIDLVLRSHQEQAAAFSTQVAQVTSLTNLQSLVIKNKGVDQFFFVMDTRAMYVAHPDTAKVGGFVIKDFSPDVVRRILETKNGDVFDEQKGYGVGYASLPTRGWIVVFAVKDTDIMDVLVVVEKFSFLQLATSLLVVSIAGSIVIWVVVGRPLRQLTSAAKQIGQGNLNVRINSEDMEDELSLLADTLNQTAAQLGKLISGLEQQVSQLNLTQESLQQSEMRFRAIFDSVNDVIFVHDLVTGKILDVNQKITEMYGYPRDEALNLSVEDLSYGRQPYSQKDAIKWFRRAAKQGTLLIEWLAKHKDGHVFWVEVSMRRANIDGKDRLLVAVRDIGERKRAEQVRVAFYRISQAAQAAYTLEELFRLVHGIIGELMPARNFYIALYDPAYNRFDFPYFIDEFDLPPASHAPDLSLTGYILDTGQPLLATPQVIEKLVDSGSIKSLGTPSVDWLGAPLTSTHGVIGVMAIKTYREDERLSEDDKGVFSLISTQVGMAIERKRADDALRESEARWRTLMENAPQVIMTIDSSAKILFLNRAFPGFSSQDAIGASLLDFTSPDICNEVRDRVEQVFIDGISTSFEMPVVSPDGVITWYACNLAPLAMEWHIGMAILNATNITDRKKAEDALRASEELYRRAIAAAGAVPYYQDYQTDSYTFMGSHVRDITGYSPEEMSPTLWRQLVQEVRLLGEAARYSEEDALKLLRTGDLPIWQCDYRIRTRDGQMRWIFDAAIEVRNANGVAQGVIGILQDFTERRLAEDEIRKLNEDLERRVVERTAQLEATNKELEAFSYSVSHDLRAPLRALDGFSRILLQDYASLMPAEGVGYVNIIRSNAQQMGHLIDDLLAFSRLSRQSLNRQPVDNIDLVNQALEMLAGEKQGRKVDIKIGKLPMCQGDATLLRQVWVNLLSNALKFSRHRKLTKIKIDTLHKDDEVVFYVKDNGTGFDMKYADKLFGVFQRLHRSEDFEGTGVGLAIVQRIIRRHGGRIWVNAEVDKGATFYFTIGGEEPAD